MVAKIDIENAKLNNVITYECPVLEFNETGIIKFDISKLSEKELEILSLAIDTSPETTYTDIEMFFIDDDECPFFGSDYYFSIKNSVLIADYDREVCYGKEGENALGWKLR